MTADTIMLQVQGKYKSYAIFYLASLQWCSARSVDNSTLCRCVRGWLAAKNHFFFHLSGFTFELEKNYEKGRNIVILLGHQRQLEIAHISSK